MSAKSVLHPWGADAVWQLYSPDGRPLDDYILSWGNRLVVLEPSRALTAEQVALAGERLAP